MKRLPLLLTLLLAAPLAAQQQPLYDRLLTTHPANEYEPAVSPDGRWLVFVTERDGLPQLAIRDLTARNGAAAKPFLPAPGRAGTPAFSPDGKRLVFVSTREDALGDIFMMDFPEGTPRKLTTRGLIDQNPWFSADGTQVNYESRSVDGEPEAMTIQVGGGKASKADATAPIFEVATPFPLRMFDRHGRVAMLFSDDTNRDGVLTKGDDTTAWELRDGVWLQATPPLPQATSIALDRATNELFVAANWARNYDIAAIGKTPLRDGTTPDKLLDLGREILRTDSARIATAISYFEAAHRRTQAGPLHSDAALAHLKALNLDGRWWQASTAGERYLDETQEGIESLKLRAQYLRARFELAQRRSDEDVARYSPPENLEGQYRDLLDAFTKAQAWEEVAEVHYALGRMFFLQQDFPRALDETAIVLQELRPQVSSGIVSRTLLFRAGVYDALGLGSELEGSLISIFELNPTDRGILDEAANRLVAIAEGRSPAAEQAILELRALAEKGRPYPYLFAKVRTAEGRHLVAAKMFADAEHAFADGASVATAAPYPAAEAASELAALQAEQGNYAGAIASMRALEERLGGEVANNVPVLYRETRLRVIQYFLDKGRSELLLGDPLLALSTYEQLLQIDPVSVEGWRGKIQALSTQPALLATAIEEYKLGRAPKAASALAHYKYGLALSYREPTSKTALKEVRRAITLESTVPFFYLTEGFILEQQFRAAQARGERPVTLVEQALTSYQQGIAFTNPDETPQLQADLLLNSGNGAMLLDQTYRAASFYRRRAEAGINFPDTRTQFLFHWDFGLATYRSGDPVRAAQEFEEAVAEIPGLVHTKKIVAERAEGIRQELVGRRALALMDAGKHREAEELFRQVEEFSAPNSLMRVRAVRNRAVLLERQAAMADGSRRSEFLRRSGDEARRALELLANPKLEADPDYSGGNALINMSFVFSTDKVGGGAKLGFDRTDEERLLHATLGRVAQLQGDHATAVASMQEQLRKQPTIDDTNRAYQNSIRSVTLSRLAQEAADAGRLDEALDHTLEGLALSRFEVATLPFIDANGATRHLLQTLEVALAMPKEPELRRPESFWMLTPEELAAAPSAWEVLRLAAQKLEIVPDPVVGDATVPVVAFPQEKARLLLVRTLAAERQAEAVLSGTETEASAALYRDLATLARTASEASTCAERLRSLALESPTGDEIFRYAALAQGTVIRLAANAASEKQLEARLADASTFAADTGQPWLVWWLEAQVALRSGNGAVRTRYAERALATLEATPVLAADPESAVPWAIFDRLEAIQLAGSDQDPATLWNITDRWRVVRLSRLAEGADPTPRGEDDERWLRDYGRVRAQYTDLQRDLRNLPFASAPVRVALLARGAELRDQLTAKIEEGRAALYPSAKYFHPPVAGFDTASVLLQPPFFFPHEPRFLLNRQLPGLTLRALYTPQGNRVLKSDEAVPADVPVFIYGEPPAQLPADSVLLLTSQSFYEKFEKLSFKVTSSRVQFPPTTGDAAVQGKLLADLRTAYELEITAPLQAFGRYPQQWLVGASSTTLGDLLQPAPNLERITMQLAPPTGENRLETLGKTMGAAGWLDQQGVVEAKLSGSRWLGVSLSPKDVPDLARSEMNAINGALEQAIADADNSRTVVSLEKVILIKEALDDTAELEGYYAKLAEVRAQLRRNQDAEAAATRRMEILAQAADTDPRYMADSRRWRAVIATMTREWETAEEFFDLAVADYERLGVPEAVLAARRDKATMYENAGRFQEAFALAEEVRAASADPAMAIGQDIRMARIARIYLNRYTDAETLLLRARSEAAAANLADLELDALLNLARVQESMGLFDKAMEYIDAAEVMAKAQNAEEKLGEVALERANVHWYRSDYFNAFREQATALEIGEKVHSLPLKVAGRNISGLISWSVNDLPRALAEFDEALRLADEMGVEAETATTCNNLGLVYRAQKRYPEALDWFGRAQAIDDAEANRWGQGYSLRNIGITHLNAGDPAKAIASLDGAVKTSGEIGDQVNLAKSLLARGDAHAALKNSAAAIADYTAALEKARAIPLPDVQWRSLYGLGLTALAEGRRDEAVVTLTEAVDVVDALRASIRIEEFQDGFLLDKQDLYNTVVQVQLDRNDVKAAFEASEKARGRNFVDLLGNRKLTLGNQTDAAKLAREGELRAAVERAEREFANAVPSRRDALAKQLEDARRAFSDFSILLRSEDPQLSGFVRVNPVSIADIQKLLDPETRLVSYHVLPKETVIFVLGPQTLEHYRVAADAQELGEKILAARQALQDFKGVDEQLFQLSQVLVEPMVPSLVGVKRIGIIPHRQLHTLPFAALPVGGEKLIDRVAIFYAPSASVLQYTMGRRTRSGPRNGAVLAIGNPDLGAKSMDLPFAEKEAERLRFVFPDLKLLTGREATETWIREHLGEYGVVHIASHGEYKPENPLFSAVLLSRDAQNDGNLSAEEVFGLQLRADLVSLSACQSGLGRISNGDDIIGLNRAFVYAGTRQLLTTLWRVDDISTAVLFKYFYRNAETMDRAEALRQAQIQLKARTEYRHPAHWSALVLSGDWQ